MKVAFLASVLAILIGTLLLSMWMRRPSYEGFETAPECTYSAEISNRYIAGCANVLEFPFLCDSYATLDEAKRVCSKNPNCRGIVKGGGPSGPGSVAYSIRTGGDGATDYTNLETMKRDILGPSLSEATYLITNLAQCKPNTLASTVTTVDKTEGAKFRQPPPGMMGPGEPGMTGPRIVAQNGSMGPGGPGMMGSPEFVMTGESVTVPGNTLLAVPAGQTIFARRAGAGAAAGGATESTPAPTGSRFIQRSAGSTNVDLATEANLTAEERAGITGLPIALGLKIVDAVRRGSELNEVLSADELAILRAARQGSAINVGSNPTALLTTPSLALNSQTTGTLTSADLLAIQQAAAAGASSVINA